MRCAKQMTSFLVGFQPTLAVSRGFEPPAV